MFPKIKNIDQSIRFMRFLTVASLLSSFIITCFIAIRYMQLAAKLQDRIYILSAGNTFEAKGVSRRENREVEAREHIRKLHALFFTLAPDETQIERNIKESLYLVDESGRALYENLKESGYYNSLISGNVSQEIQILGIRLTTKDDRLFFDCIARLKIVRTSKTIYRDIVSNGYLRETARSDMNPHGFLVENWKTLMSNK